MFNIGFSELLIIAALALIFIGPKQLPEVARAVGKFLNELKRASDEALQVFKETQSKSNNFIAQTQEELSKIENYIDEKPAEKTKEKSLDNDKKEEQKS